MNLRSLRRRVDALAWDASEDERLPPEVKIRLPYAGILDLGEHRRGPAMVQIVPIEERRSELVRFLTPDEVEARLRREAQQDEASLARQIAICDEVMSMTTERRAAMLAEFDAKRRVAKGEA